MNKTIIEVTDNIIKRSQKGRKKYLEMIENSKKDGTNKLRTPSSNRELLRSPESLNFYSKSSTKDTYLSQTSIYSSP